MSRKKLYLLGPLAIVAALALSACSPSSGGTTTTEETTAPPAVEETMAPEAEMDPAANLVGPGCAGYAEAVPDGARLGRRNGSGSRWQSPHPTTPS